LSKEEKERLIKEAEQFTEQDKKKREEAELRNNADNLIYTAEKTKKDLGEKLTQDQKNNIDAVVSALKDAMAGMDLDKIKTKSDDLTKLLQEIGTAVYQQAAAGQAKQKKQRAGGAPPPESGPNEDKVVDSEDYKVK
jgi:molecular chaperone DnaK